jgi:hypothetical protein
MKKSRLHSLSICLVSTVLLFSASCKKETAAPSPVVMGHFYFHLHSNINTTELDSTNPIALDANGRQIKLTVAQCYISAIRLKKPDGNYQDLSGSIILKTIPNEEFLVGDVPTGNYTSVSFDIGLGNPVNSTSPSTYPATSILAPQNPSMWFGSTSQGYMFMNVQGLVDTSASNTGAVNFPVSYQIGTSALLQSIQMPNQTFSVVAGQNNFIHLICDYGKLLQGINFKTQSTASPFVNAAVAAQIAANIPNMFRYE